MRPGVIARAVVAVLLATGPALAEAPCPPKDIFSPIPDAEDLTFETADLSTAGVPLAWQMGVIGQSHYRLFPDGSGSIGEDHKMSGWRLDFICDAHSKGCQFTGVQNPPSSAMEAAKKIGACLMYKSPVPSPKTAEAEKPADLKPVAPQSGSPAAGGPKLPTTEPAKPAIVATADAVIPPEQPGTVGLAPVQSKVQPVAAIPSPIVQAPPGPIAAPKIPPAAEDSNPTTPSALPKPPVTPTTPVEPPKDSSVQAGIPAGPAPTASLPEPMTTDPTKLAPEPTVSSQKPTKADTSADAKPSADPASPPIVSMVPPEVAKTATAVPKPAQTGMAGPVRPPASKIAVAPPTASGPPPKAAGLIVSNQQLPPRQGPRKVAALGPRIPKSANRMVPPALPLRWPSSNFDIEARSAPATKTGAATALQKAQCWVVNLPNDSPLATVQRLLLLSGYDAGPIDGKNGLRTLKAEQIAFGEGASRLTDDEMIARLKARLCDDPPQP